MTDTSAIAAAELHHTKAPEALNECLVHMGLLDDPARTPPRA